MSSPGRWLTFGSKSTRRAGIAAARIIAFSFLLGDSLDVLGAVVALTQAGSGPGAVSTQTDTAALVGYAIILGFALAAAVLGVRTARRAPLGLSVTQLGLVRPAGVSRRRAWAAAAVYVAILATAIWWTVGGLDLLGIHGTGVSATPGGQVAELVHAATAGLNEEPVLLALPLALAARVRWPWWAVFGLLVVLRISFHIYLGWPALFVVPWIAAAMLLWRWCPVLWPFVLGHGTFDVLQYLRDATDHRVTAAATAAADGIYLAGAAVAAVVVWRWVRSRRGPAVVPGNLVT